MRDSENVKSFVIKEVSSSVVSSTVINNFFAFLDVAPITVRSYTSGIKQFISFLQEQRVKNPTRENVLAFKKDLIAKGRKPATISLYLSALRRFFDWTEAEKLYPNVTRGIKSPKQDKGHKKDYFSGSQLKDIIQSMNRNTVEGKRNYAMFLLMSTCGLRTIEITRADISDIRTVAGTSCLFIQGKGRLDKKDFVKLSPQVEEAVRDYLKARGNANPYEPLFVSESKRNHGQRITTRTVSMVAKNSMRHAGFDSSRLTAHSLRHSAVTLALQAGMSLPDVQQFARHSSINVTMVYNHAVNRMNSMCETAITQSIFGL